MTKSREASLLFQTDFPDYYFDSYILRKFDKNKCSGTLSFTKVICALTKKNLHAYYERNIYAYHNQSTDSTVGSSVGGKMVLNKDFRLFHFTPNFL